MTKNYFSIERGGAGFDHIHIVDDNKNVMFEDVMNMSYDEIKTYSGIGAFVVSAMDASNEMFGSTDEQTIITLIDEDDVFIWSIIMGKGESDIIQYVFVDWRKDGKFYRYEKN